jgi:presenilin-like A22 family membrane protease
MPLPARFAVIGSLVFGIGGGIAGLIIGLFAYPPTAWFAVAELGLPAAVLGSLAGFVVGFVVQAVRRTRRHLAS